MIKLQLNPIRNRGKIINIYNYIKLILCNNRGVEIGTACKNGGCQCSYSTPDSEMSQCQFHPGSPIFHEGMKYWSCCQKKTTDFTAFMNQKGCSFGKHKWTKDVSFPNLFNSSFFLFKICVRLDNFHTFS